MFIEVTLFETKRAALLRVDEILTVVSGPGHVGYPACTVMIKGETPWQERSYGCETPYAAVRALLCVRGQL